ncbi:restriction endonuclease subunit S [Bifidobacterium reuteri]|nr:restriction endonuclease subunit S [Bifidobacterium reuteri]
MERYSKYKDSGVDWIGEIPEGWKTTAIRHVLQLHSGSALPDDQYDAEGDFPVYGGGAIRGRANQCNVQGQTVIVSRQGATCGTTRFIGGNAWITEHALIAYFLDAMYNKRYFAYVLHAMNLGNLSMTAAQPGISASIVQNQHTPVPNHIEQQAIADYLDEKTAAIDAAVADVERSIELLNEYRQSVISEAVTKGLDPNAPMKDSGIDWIGQIPAHWLMLYPKKLFALRKDRAHADDQQLTASQKYGVISQKHFMELENQRVMSVITGSDILKHVEAGDFVISMRSFQGGLEYSYETGKISSAYVMVYPFTDQTYSEYYRHLFKTLNYIQALQSTSNLVRDGQALRYSNFTQVYLPVPPLNEQQGIAKYLNDYTNSIDSLIAQKQSLIVRLKEYRSSLISECVTGKVKVPGVKED